MAEENEPEIELSPRLETLSDEYAADPTSRKFLPLAEEYRKSRMYDEAIYICKEGLKHHTDYPPALITLARCLIEIKNYDEARSTLQDLLDKNPDNPTANKYIGELYMKSGDFDRAREHFLKVKEQRPGDQEVELLLKKMDQPESSSPESVDMSGEGELNLEREELLQRSTLDWIEEGEELDPDLGEPEEEPVFLTEPTPQPIDLSGSKKEDDSLDLDREEGEEEIELELSLGGEEEPARRASLEEEEPVKTFDIKTEEDEPPDQEAIIAEADEVRALEEIEEIETEKLLEEQKKDRILQTEQEGMESLEIEGVEIPLPAELEIGEEGVQELVDEEQEVLTVEEGITSDEETPDIIVDEHDQGPRLELDDIEVGGDLEEIVMQDVPETEEDLPKPPVSDDAGEELEITTAEGELIEAEAEVEVEAIEEVGDLEGIVVADEGSEEITEESLTVEFLDEAPGIEVIELDQLSEEELSEFPAEELQLDRSCIVKEGQSPEGIQVGTLEESLEEQTREELESEADLEFELGDDFVLEGVEGKEELEDLATAHEVELEEPAVVVVEEAAEDEESVAPPTRTSAEIYEQQGHYREALNIYRKLLDADPENQEFADKIAELQQLLTSPETPEVSKESLTKVEILNSWLSNIDAFRKRVHP
ncbi:MAG TPA: tetratricopeptide repeat protein [Acidobacteriota bacterium]|nr:tetratricopeptide repeat protein [Acidobacteriota bacterium]